MVSLMPPGGVAWPRGAAANRHGPTMRTPSYGFAPDMSRRFQRNAGASGNERFTLITENPG